MECIQSILKHFEKCLQQNVKLFILCNPHNPGGIVWKEHELKEMLRLCTKYDVLILSDEIHADLVFPEHKHIPLAKLAGEEAGRIITCVAPTKTFNLAGVQVAIMIATDEEVREKIDNECHVTWANGFKSICCYCFKGSL